MDKLRDAIEIAPGVRMVHADCLDILPLEPAEDERVHVITDPPYEDELHMAAARGKIKRLNGLGFEGVNGQRDFFCKAMADSCSGWLLTFSLAEGVRAWRDGQQAAGGKWDTTLAWVKPDSTPRLNGQGAARGFECITAAWCGKGHRSWNGGGKRGVYTHCCNWSGRVSAKDGGHPTEKPLNLMIELVRDYTQPGELVIDPFAGSGTTGEACMKLGRRFLGIEKNKRFFEMTVARLQAVEDQGDLFRDDRYKNVPLPL